MQLFQRISDIISANLNELIGRFEDPELGLKLAMREMDQAVAVALDGAVKAVATEKLLARELAENQRQAERCRLRAQQHVAANEDDLARRVITRKIQHESLAAALSDQHRAAAEVSATLRRQISGMQAKLAEARRSLATMIARKRAAEARRQLLSVSSQSNASAASHRFAHLYGQLEMAEAEADAFCEMSGLNDDEVFANDETSMVEQELAALKELVGK